MLYTGKMVQVILGIPIKTFSRFRIPYLEMDTHYLFKSGVVHYTESGVERLREVAFKLNRINNTITDIFNFYGKSRGNKKPSKENNIIRNVIISHLEGLGTPRDIISYLTGLRRESFCYANKSIARLRKDRFARIMIMDVKEIVKVNIRDVKV